MSYQKIIMTTVIVLSGIMLTGNAEGSSFSVSELAGADDILTDGTLVTAVNCGYALASGDVTVGGVILAPGGNASEGGIDDYSQTGGTGLNALGWDVGTIYAGEAGTTDVFNDLFNSMVWQTGSVNVGHTLTLHLTGLNAGQDYRLQMFFGDSRPSPAYSHPFTVTVEGSTSDVFSYGTASTAIAKAIRVEALLTASGSDVDVTLTVADFDPLLGGVSLSAYALHQTGQAQKGLNVNVKSGFTVHESPDSQLHSDTFDVSLTMAPEYDVTVTIEDKSDPNQVDIEPVLLSFTSSNWNQPRTVMVTAVNDVTMEALEHQTTLSLTVASQDADYQDLGKEFTCFVQDNECGHWGYLSTDLNKDCRIDFLDIALMAAQWLDGTTPYGYLDLALMSYQWLGCTTPYSSGCLEMDFNLASMVQPLYEHSIFEDPNWYHWGAHAIEGNDGKYHLFYSRWRSTDGWGGWLMNCEIAHAISDYPEGPYTYVDTALAPRGSGYWDQLTAHNPKIYKFEGKYYLYYIGTNDYNGTDWDSVRNAQRTGVAVSNSLSGPWQRFDEPVLSPDNVLITNVAVNPTVVKRKEGDYLLAVKGDDPAGGLRRYAFALSDSPMGPFSYVGIFQPGFNSEDGHLWYDRLRDKYFMMVTHAYQGVKLTESNDSLNWQVSEHLTVLTNTFDMDDGTQQTCYRVERPAILIDEYGVPVVIFATAKTMSASTNPLSKTLIVPLKNIE
jgi:hypothetical protein